MGANDHLFGLVCKFSHESLAAQRAQKKFPDDAHRGFLFSEISQALGSDGHL
jgi:hypothetical protein